MTTPTADDRRLTEAFGELGPSPEAAERMEARVIAGYAAEQRSLAAEWLDLFRVGPVLNAGLAVGAAAGVAVAGPFATILMLVLLL